MQCGVQSNSTLQAEARECPVSLCDVLYFSETTEQDCLPPGVRAGSALASFALGTFPGTQWAGTVRRAV